MGYRCRRVLRISGGHASRASLPPVALRCSGLSTATSMSVGLQMFAVLMAISTLSSSNGGYDYDGVEPLEERMQDEYYAVFIGIASACVVIAWLSVFNVLRKHFQVQLPDGQVSAEGFSARKVRRRSCMLIILFGIQVTAYFMAVVQPESNVRIEIVTNMIDTLML